MRKIEVRGEPCDKVETLGIRGIRTSRAGMEAGGEVTPTQPTPFCFTPSDPLGRHMRREEWSMEGD